jgi:DNA topoisomerase I
MVRRLSKSDMAAFKQEPEHSAAQADLEYVSGRGDGIRRIKAGTHFQYTWNSSKVTSGKTLERIRKLAIPPAWTEVWICASDRGHLQATGFDVMGRKQYRYHTHWNEARNQTKFHGLAEFGKSLPDLRKRLISDLSLPGLSRDKVLATVVSLMERTFIRIGNAEYERLYGSYGLTTLKDGHVDIKGPVMKFAFRGKKGINHTITLKNKKLAKIVKACRDIPGKELFQYINEQGERCTIDSGMVNNYIREATGRELSAKDFRTWAGTLSILNSFRELEPPTDLNSTKKNVIAALDEVSIKLGNTRTVCKKYYVHPQIVKLYEEGGLGKYLDQMEGDSQSPEMSAQLTSDEKVLMKILQKLQHL